MAKFPEPPAVSRLAAIPPELRILPAGSRIWRIYFRSSPHPTFWDAFRSFGPTTSRFDHHLPPPRPQPRAILYGALQGPTCLAEVFQTTRTVDRTTHHPWLVAFDLVRDIQLLDLNGTWPTRAGASMAIANGARPRARRWSQVIYAAYPQVQGIFYPSSMCANRPAVALYERSQGALPTAPSFHRSLADPALLSLLQRAVLDLGYGLV